MTEVSFRLHHVGILVANIVQSAELFTRRFGYVVESPVVEDQHQTAFVQFLRLGDADHWTELISPNSPQSVLSRALKQRQGGVHHMCYEVADINLACSRLRGMSMTLISDPAAAVAFGGRCVAWLTDRDQTLVELVESGAGPLALPPSSKPF